MMWKIQQAMQDRKMMPAGPPEFIPMFMAKFPAHLARSREPSQPALSYQHIENFTKDLEVLLPHSENALTSGSPVTAHADLTSLPLVKGNDDAPPKTPTWEEWEANLKISIHSDTPPLSLRALELEIPFSHGLHGSSFHTGLCLKTALLGFAVPFTARFL